MPLVTLYNQPVEISLDEVWSAAETWERGDFAQEHGGEVIDFLGGEIAVALEDPAKRLEVIVALRALGYTVEFA